MDSVQLVKIRFRRQFLLPTFKVFLFLTVIFIYLSSSVILNIAAGETKTNTIDRFALVTRHNPVIRSFDVESPLSVGNGEFAFTVDVTGLQTFPECYEKTIPLCTMSQWGWHTFPNPQGYSIGTYKFTQYNSHGRMVGYADIPDNIRTDEVNWLRGNPHRLNLARLGLVLIGADGSPGKTNDITDIHQVLNLWDGILLSSFRFQDIAVNVETVCEPSNDVLAVRIKSDLLNKRRLGVLIAFPYGSGSMTASDWTKPDAHSTTFIQQGAQNKVRFFRKLDQDIYEARLEWTGKCSLSRTSEHHYVVMPSGKADTIEFVFAFSLNPLIENLPDFASIKSSAKKHWNNFWRSGAAIDLSLSKDPRWRELERRIILSQYLTAIQCAGSYPPQESGLTFNSWEGKFHLEMHWWHSVHFALWDRLFMLERSLWWYRSILPQAKAMARRQGYSGARMPKMTDPSGRESPSPVGLFLIWQQPHPIYYAELCYLAEPSRETLQKYSDIVFECAEFMASFASREEDKDRYVLGPPLQCAQERYPKEKTFNPTYELTYWRWGLETAQKWRERLQLPRNEYWQRVLAKLSKPAVLDGKYLFAESAPDSYTNPRYRTDHPSVLGALGFLPGHGIDREIMRETFHWVWSNWSWKETWGWDYPLTAMCAARLGEQEKAIDALLMDTPKNKYRLNGHNHQRQNLTVYLPGNGGLLTAVAMMAGGWDGAPPIRAPGFPTNGQWTVLYENFKPMP